MSKEIRFRVADGAVAQPGTTAITPAFDHLDAIGLPRPRIAFTVGTYVRDGMAAAKDVARAAVHRSCGPPNGTTPTSRSAPGHLIGTTAMGADPTRSVVNGDGRARRVEPVRGGSSVFPT